MAVQFDNDSGINAKSVTASSTLIVGSTDVTTTLAATASTSGGTASATVAATGSVITNAAAITADFTLVSAGDATTGVILPVATAARQLMVKNNANAVLKVYPQVNSTINALSANSSISMAAFTCAIFKAYNTTAWYTLPLLPS